MIFLYFLVILIISSSGVRSQDSYCVDSVEVPETQVEIPKNTGKCSDGFLYFYRTPRPENQHTSGWCLKLIKAQQSISQRDGEMLCAQNGAQISIFDNHGEEVKMFGSLPASERIINVRIDGYRKEKCKIDHNIWNDPDCRKGYAFQMKSNFTDPTYQLNNFQAGDPNYYTKGDDPNAEFCITLSAVRHETQDLSCLGTAPGWNMLGVLCGKKPN